MAELSGIKRRREPSKEVTSLLNARIPSTLLRALLVRAEKEETTPAAIVERALRKELGVVTNEMPTRETILEWIARFERAGIGLSTRARNVLYRVFESGTTPDQLHPRDIERQVVGCGKKTMEEIARALAAYAIHERDAI